MGEIGKATVERVRAAFGDGPTNYGEIRKKVEGVGHKSIRFAVRQLIEEGAVAEVGGTFKNPIFAKAKQR